MADGDQVRVLADPLTSMGSDIAATVVVRGVVERADVRERRDALEAARRARRAAVPPRSPKEAGDADGCA